MAGTFHSEASRQKKREWPCFNTSPGSKNPKNRSMVGRASLSSSFSSPSLQGAYDPPHGVHTSGSPPPFARSPRTAKALEQVWPQLKHNEPKSMVQRCELTFRRTPCRRQCISDMCLAAWTYLYWFLWSFVTNLKGKYSMLPWIPCQNFNTCSIFLIIKRLTKTFEHLSLP